MFAGRPLLVTLLLLAAAPAPAQQLNRLVANHEPEIRLDARGRNGVCDVLAFTPDGRTLLAAGEDKVVHRFTVRDDGLAPAGSPLAWNTFRERRGSIYALAADAPHGRVAVAGFGKLDADVSLLDLASGAITAALPYPADANGVRSPNAQHTVWALAFKPDGSELAAGDDGGNVWTWKPGAEAVARLAVAGSVKATEGSRVVWVGYPNGRLAYALRDGGVYTADGKKPLHRWGQAVGAADRVVASGDGSALAARPYRGHAGNGVEVWWPATGTVKTVIAPADHFPERATLDAAGKRLAVGYIDYTGRPPTGFGYDRPGEVRVYDLTADPPKEVARTAALPACPDQLAFHPDGQRLATADRTAHNTSLWRLDGKALARLPGAVPSDTQPMWAVGLTADGRHLCAKFDRAAVPTHPNRRAAADKPWHAFALLDDRRGWVDVAATPVPPADERNGWRVRCDPVNDFQWKIVEPSGKEQPLADVWDVVQDDLPRCYTFLPGPGGGTRLAIGHLWGVSVYDLRPGQKPVRVRKLVGHAGYVTSVAPTHGGKGLVTAGRDHTVAFWNLADFPHQPLLGASFAQANGKLTVAAVDAGSPADEIGLAAGDVVSGLMANGVRQLVSPDQWLDHLTRPQPDHELALQVARGDGKPQWTKTKLLHRPSAKLVALRDDEWVLYTYRQCYYDSSANADRVVQWLVSKDKPEKTPDVFPVGDFRPHLRKPEKVTDLLARQQREPAKPELVEKFPPRVDLVVANPVVANNADPVLATVTVTPRATASGRPSQVAAVELWLNDHHRVGRQEIPVGQVQAADQPLPVFRFTVPNSDLVGGDNRLTARVLARDGSWGTTAAPRSVRLTAQRTVSRRLYGVAAGVSEYNRYQLTSDDLDLVNSADDAARVLAAWTGLRGTGGYAADNAPVPLLRDEQVTKEAILGHIRAAKGKARADDVFVVILSGHGMRGDGDGRLEGTRGGGTDHWYFLVPNHQARPLGKGDLRQPARVKEACLSAQEVFEALAELPCWKVVLLDCCHSGQAAKGAMSITKNSPDAFRAGGLGPVVLAACAENQLSAEPAGKSDLGGVFSRQIVAAFGRDFAKVARADGRLSAADLAQYVKEQVPKDAARILVDGKPHTQHAVITPLDDGDLRRLVLAEKKDRPKSAKPVGFGN